MTEEVLEALRLRWQRNPEWRLGQLICNIMPPNMNMHEEDFETKLFYMQDETILKALKYRRADRDSDFF